MTFLHGSRKRFEPGFTLTAQKDGYVNQPDVIAFELMVESRRPMDKISRMDAVFLCVDPDLIDAAGGYNDAIYSVTPIGDAQPSDLSWYSEAYCEYTTTPHDTQLINTLIDNYWSGLPHTNQDSSVIEYRVHSATVESIYELNVDECDLEKPVSNPGLRPKF